MLGLRIGCGFSFGGRAALLDLLVSLRGYLLLLTPLELLKSVLSHLRSLGMVVIRYDCLFIVSLAQTLWPQVGYA